MSEKKDGKPADMAFVQRELDRLEAKLSEGGFPVSPADREALLHYFTTRRGSVQEIVERIKARKLN